MKKLFTFVCAAVLSIGAWAADYIPAATAIYTVGDATTLNTTWKSGLNNTENFYTVGDTIVMSPFVLYQSGANSPYQAWTGQVGGSSSKNSWTAIANRCFKGSATWFTSDAKFATVRSNRKYYYHVTNCTQVLALVKTSNSITLSVNAYEISGNSIAEEAAHTTTYKSSSDGIVSLEGLNATKKYRIEFVTDDNNNSSFYEIGFVFPHPAPTLEAIKIAGVNATILAANPEDQDTIQAQLPYGTIINDAIDNIKAADLTLGGSATTYSIAENRSKLTVSDGVSLQQDYIFDLSVETSASTDATLKALSLNGVAIALVADKYAYSIDLPYATSIDVVAEANDAAAKNVAVDKSVAGTVTITVTAQADNTQVYTVNYTILPAKKDLLEVAFSNGAKGAITNGLIRVPYLRGTSAPTFSSAAFWNADGEPTAAVVEGKLKVTGVDGLDSLYAIETVELTPASVAYDTQITFDSTETYIFSTYGFGDWKNNALDPAKGWKFAKKVEEANNKRISDGRTRLYFALPAAAALELTSGTGGERAIKVYVNGVANSVSTTAAADASITINGLSTSEPNFIAIESNQTGGDGGFIKMKVVKTTTAIDNAEVGEKAVKMIENGQLVIKRDGKTYTITGVQLR